MSRGTSRTLADLTPEVVYASQRPKLEPCILQRKHAKWREADVQTEELVPYHTLPVRRCRVISRRNLGSKCPDVNERGTMYSKVKCTTATFLAFMHDKLSHIRAADNSAAQLGLGQ